MYKIMQIEPKIPSIIIISGSCRQDSAHLKLAKVCLEESKSLTLGGHVPPPTVVSAETVAELQRQIPLFDEDIEKVGFPQAVIDLKKLMTEADGILWLNPEYNGSFTPLMKNTIDWASRGHEPNEQYGGAYKDKVCAIISTSPGGLGGVRGQPHLREVLHHLRCDVIGANATIGHCFSAFKEDGSLVDEKNRIKVHNVVEALVHRCAI